MVCWCSKILLIFLKQSLHNWILIKNRPACSLYIKYVLTWHEASLAYNLKKMKVNSLFEIPEFNQQHHSKDVLDLLHFFASSMNNRFVTFFMYLYTHILCMHNCDTNHDQQANWPNTFDIDFQQSRIRKKDMTKS